jgi:Calx-beta domain-containing protein
MRTCRLAVLACLALGVQIAAATPSPAATPSLTISNRTVVEGNSGQVAAVFAIKLSAASGSTVTVAYATKNGTAKAPGDYVAASGTVSFPAGTLVRRRTIQVNGDTLDEGNERFQVRLSAPTNATIADGIGSGTIVDDDCTETDTEPNDSDNTADSLGSVTIGNQATTNGVICPEFGDTQDHFSATGTDPGSGSGTFSMTVDLTYNAAIAPLSLQGGLIPGTPTETSTTGSGHEQVVLTWPDTAGDDSRPVYARVYGSTTNENSYTLTYTLSEA